MKKVSHFVMILTSIATLKTFYLMNKNVFLNKAEKIEKRLVSLIECNCFFIAKFLQVSCILILARNIVILFYITLMKSIYFANLISRLLEPLANVQIAANCLALHSLFV